MDIQVDSVRPQGWFWADNSLIDDYGPRIGPYGIALYMALARHANKERASWPSYDRLALETGMSRSMVIRTAKVLEGEGLITVQAQQDPTSTVPNQTNRYTLCALTITVTVYSAKQQQGGVPQTPPPCTTDTPPVYTVHSGGVPQTPKQEPVNKTQEPERGTARPGPFTLLPDMLDWATAHVPNVNVHAEYDAFMDWARANGKTYKDWPAAFRNWLRKAPAYLAKAPARPSGPAPASTTYAPNAQWAELARRRTDPTLHTRPPDTRAGPGDIAR